MDRNGAMQGGVSRIPRFDHGNKTMAGVTSFNHQQPLPGVGASQKPSRLEQMQVEYQRNMLKQKEEKLINMYEENQKRALNKVNQKKGFVRDFFSERRAHSGHRDPNSPTIEQLYLQKKIESEYTGTQQNGYDRAPGNKPVSKMPPYNTNSLKMGRDRANPLAPIQPNGGNDAENPFNRRKAQMVRPRTYKGSSQQASYPTHENIPRSAPNMNIHEKTNNNFEDDGSPLPNNNQLHHLQQRRKMLQAQRENNKTRTTQQNRAHVINSKTPQSKRTPQYEYQTSEDEGYDETARDNSAEDEIKRKQQELLAQIEAQQRELDRLRNERMQAEHEEKQEVDRRRKIEEERRKRAAEEEKRRKKEQEDERMRQQWEEEKQQKVEEEKRQMRQTVQYTRPTPASKSRNSITPESDEYLDSYMKKHTPTPPPHPIPANTRKIVPSRQPPPPQRSPSPLPGGDHMALYEQAGALDGAYENVGRLKSCYNCGRTFAEDRLQKHEQSCKNITKKRKVLDTSKLRTRGTEMEQYQGHRQPTPPQPKKNNWRAKHESFMQAIKYAKKVSQIEREGGNLADLPPPPPSENPDYVQCPHCTRRFNPTAAERHIPHCKNSRAKPPPQRRR